MTSLEALVRWNHPTEGMLGPDEFIGLAEETGLILNLGELVIDLVCAQIAQWAQGVYGRVPVSAQGLATGLGWFSIGLGLAELLAPRMWHLMSEEASKGELGL